MLATLIKGARLRVERLPYVHGCLVSGFDTTRYDVFSADQDRCLRPSDVVAYLTEPAHLRGKAGHYATAHQPLVAAISGSPAGAADLPPAADARR